MKQKFKINKFFLFLKNNKLYKDGSQSQSSQQRIPKQINVANNELKQGDSRKISTKKVQCHF